MGTELSDLMNVSGVEAQDFIGDIKKNGFSWSRLWTLIQAVVKVVENFSKVVDREVSESNLKGESKQALAIRLINDNIDIPFVPEWMEASVIKFFVDKAVDQFNKSGVFSRG